MMAFAALAIRGLAFAVVTDPYVVIAAQLLDGVSAAILGVMFPLVVADATRGSGRFNLGLGIVGSALGIGAALSTLLAGYVVDHFGRSVAFVTLAGVATIGLAIVVMLMPETRPDAEEMIGEETGETVAPDLIERRVPSPVSVAH